MSGGSGAMLGVAVATSEETELPFALFATTDAL